MSGVVLGLDQGTSSTRCLVLGERLETLALAAVPVGASFPGPGRVEQDPAELVQSAHSAIQAALDQAALRTADVAAVGIANQTETFIVAERATARPVHPAIVWQDRRTSERCAALAGHAARVRELTGLQLDATFPATKLAWLLDHCEGLRARAEAGELVYHDVGGWLVRHLCGGEICEVSNAGRTLLCALGGRDWDEGLLDLFGVPRALLPPIVDSDELVAEGGLGLGAEGELGLGVSGGLGDQQASLLGLGCLEPGSAKVTLGTGAFILVQAGANPPRPPEGVLAACAWRRRGESSFALEGFVPTAGAALAWFTEMGVLPEPSSLGLLLGGAGEEDGSVVCVPAFQGLGTPSWQESVRGGLLGLSRATTRAQIARAVIDGVLHQVADALEAVAARLPVDSVLLDGGLSRSDWIVQRLAEIAGVRVERSARAEATAVGAAMMAGLATGVWAGFDEFPAVATDLVAEPSWPASERAARRERWSAAVELAAAWDP